jgi:hypothetical protein
VCAHFCAAIKIFPYGNIVHRCGRAFAVRPKKELLSTNKKGLRAALAIGYLAYKYLIKTIKMKRAFDLYQGSYGKDRFIKRGILLGGAGLMHAASQALFS